MYLMKTKTTQQWLKDSSEQVFEQCSQKSNFNPIIDHWKTASTWQSLGDFLYRYVHMCHFRALTVEEIWNNIVEFQSLILSIRLH